MKKIIGCLYAYLRKYKNSRYSYIEIVWLRNLKKWVKQKSTESVKMEMQIRGVLERPQGNH